MVPCQLAAWLPRYALLPAYLFSFVPRRRDALAHEGPFPAPLLRVAFAFPAGLHLPRLAALDVRAPMLSLPASFSELAALTRLALSGYLLELEPGCLPPGLLVLEVEWRLTMTPVSAALCAVQPSSVSLCVGFSSVAHHGPRECRPLRSAAELSLCSSLCVGFLSVAFRLPAGFSWRWSGGAPRPP